MARQICSRAAPARTAGAGPHVIRCSGSSILPPNLQGRRRSRADRSASKEVHVAGPLVAPNVTVPALTVVVPLRLSVLVVPFFLLESPMLNVAAVIELVLLASVRVAAIFPSNPAVVPVPVLRRSNRSGSTRDILTVAFPAALSVPIKIRRGVGKIQRAADAVDCQVRIATVAAAAVKLNVPVTFSVLPAPIFRTLAVEELLATAMDPIASVAPSVTELFPDASEPKTRLLAAVPLTVKLID